MRPPSLVLPALCVFSGRMSCLDSLIILLIMPGLASLSPVPETVPDSQLHYSEESRWMIVSYKEKEIASGPP